MALANRKLTTKSSCVVLSIKQLAVGFLAGQLLKGQAGHVHQIVVEAAIEDQAKHRLEPIIVTLESS